MYAYLTYCPNCGSRNVAEEPTASCQPAGTVLRCIDCGKSYDIVEAD